MKARVAVVFGQFGRGADPANLPRFRFRLSQADIETILIEHYDSKKCVDFLRGFQGFTGIVGASLGAMSAVVFAGYLQPQFINFVGGFQPSDLDPSGHTVEIKSGLDIITRAITVPPTVRNALVFRNPVAAATGWLGHATYIIDPSNHQTNLQVVEREDIHPGDFGPAADAMFNRIMELVK